MTTRDRLRAVLNLERPDDRLPVIEWASWWTLTYQQWQKEGLPSDIEHSELFAYFGLDEHRHFWLPHQTSDCPKPKFDGGPIAEGEAAYEALLPYLYPDERIDRWIESIRDRRPRHEKGELSLWITLDGGFWFPRKILGIENHLYSFYDQPELYHRMMNDLAEFQLKALSRLYEVDTPDFMTFGEDMSYNNGPMISEECFNEFLLPYYQKVVPVLKEHGTKVLVDSDGDITRMIPWLQRAGIEGVLPLERQAGVDVEKIREAYPDFLLIGAFDKMTTRQSVEAMHGEFERLLPVMKKGGFIPSMDHQTPPDCPLERYKIYVEMLTEYAEKAVRS